MKKYQISVNMAWALLVIAAVIECFWASGLKYVQSTWVYLAVDVLCHSLEQFALRYVRIEREQPSVNTWRAVIMYVSFVPHDTGLHAQHIIGFGLFPSLDVTFELELASFQPVARVILLRHDQA